MFTMCVCVNYFASDWWDYNKISCKTSWGWGSLALFSMSIDDWESIGMGGFSDIIATNMGVTKSTADEKDVESPHNIVLPDSDSIETTQDHDRVMRILSVMSWCISHHSFSLLLSTFTTHDTSPTQPVNFCIHHL